MFLNAAPPPPKESKLAVKFERGEAERKKVPPHARLQSTNIFSTLFLWGGGARNLEKHILKRYLFSQTPESEKHKKHRSTQRLKHKRVRNIQEQILKQYVFRRNQSQKIHRNAQSPKHKKTDTRIKQASQTASHSRSTQSQTASAIARISAVVSWWLRAFRRTGW